MTHRRYWILGLAAAGLLVVSASARPAAAAPPTGAYRPVVSPTSVPNRFNPNQWQARPHDNGMMPGSDWWKIYPWSPYNAWKNPYWYPPYNTSYPYPPDQAYPYPPYPVPPPYPAPPWGGPGMGGEGGIEAPLPPEKGDAPAINALGLPSANGHIDWPLGIRLLPRTSEAHVWQQQIDNLLPTAVAQAREGKAKPETVAEIKRSLDNLSDLLHSRAGNMPVNAATEAERFLQQLSASVKLLK
jgi:hypothetical protein